MALNTILLILNTNTISNSFFSSKLIVNFVSLAVYSIDNEESRLAINILSILSKDEVLRKTIIENGAIKNLINKLPNDDDLLTISILDFLSLISVNDVARTIIMNENGYSVILELFLYNNVDIQIKSCIIVTNFVNDEDFMEFVITNRTAEYLIKLMSTAIEVPVLTAGIRILLSYSNSQELIQTLKSLDPRLEFLQKLTKHFDPKIRTISQKILDTLI